MLGGSPIGEVAARYGTSRQTLHSRRRRFEWSQPRRARTFDAS
ncbi:hypothetical protein [Streptomyces sp. LUP30]